jgi:drug/metabolite transporter (DMT)-like permease
MKRSVIGFAFAMTLAGTIGVFATKSGLDSLTAVFFRCLIASICLGVYGLYKGYFSREIFKSGELPYIVVGGIALVANWILIFQAFRVATITIAVATFYVEPFFLIGLGVVLLKERFQRSTLLWTALAFVGLLMIITNSPQSNSENSNLLLGVVLSLMAGFCYAIATIIGKKIVKTPAVVMTFTQMLLGALVLFPFAHVEPTVSWGYVLPLGAIHTAFLYVLIYQTIRDVPTGLIAPLSFLDPVVTILSDVIVYSALLSGLQITGIAAILISAYFVSRPQEGVVVETT